GGTAVGAAVGVNVADVTNEASIGKGSTVTAQGLTVSATMAERDVAFDRAEKATVGDGTIDLGANHLFQTGDAVRYENGSGSSIGGLTDGKTYFVIKGEDGKVKLAASREDALAGTAIDLTSTGSGTGHKLVDASHSFGAQTVSG